MDVRGAVDAGHWIREAAPTHPSLIDTEHVVAERYGWVNVPSIAWIDEAGRVVRPNDAGWASDAFRGMMQPGFDLDAWRAETARLRDRYLARVRDWVARGAASPYALDPSEVLRRWGGASAAQADAAAHFRLGTVLHHRGRAGAAEAAFARARALHPESWSYLRQSLHLKEPGAGGGPEFWAAVDTLGDRRYYPNQDVD
jgi:hypothetical protein